MKRVFLVLSAIVLPLMLFSQNTVPEIDESDHVVSIKGPPLPCITPTTQTSGFTATATGSFTIDLAWTRGDGDNVIVLAHEAAVVDADPVSGTTYTANAAFGSGTPIGTGNYVVYIGPANAVTVTGLDPSTAYYFRAYEFENLDVCYLIPGVTANATTNAAAPSISNVSPDHFFADKGAQLTITGTYMNGASVTIAGVTGSIVSNDGSTLVVDFPAGLYINNTLTVSTGVLPNATTTVTVNTRNIIPVGGGTDPHTTIQSALNGLFAWFGTASFTTATAGYLAGAKTIEVYNGTYTDIVTPNVTFGTTAAENLIIRNAAGQAPVVNATGKNYGFYIGALNYVQITGFTVHSATIDLIYTEGDNNMIRYNRCYGSTGGTGIMIYNAPNAIVSNNLVYNNNQFGIRITASNNVSLKNNTLVDNGTESKGPPLPGVYTPAQLYVESGTGTVVQNNIFYAKTGSYIFTLLTEPGITVSSNYNTYYKNGNNFLVFYNNALYADLAAWTGHGAGANDLETDPLFVTNGSDFHIQSVYESYHAGEWPPLTALSGTWTVYASTSPALDAGNPVDAYVNEPVSGGVINQGAYGNTVQASKSNGVRWDGSTSTDWQDVTNWTPEMIPIATDDVTIPDGCPNYPVVDDGITTAVCNNLLIGTLSSVMVAPNGQMSINGSVSNNAGAAGMVVQSDATGDGSLIVHNEFPATVERYIVGNQWHMIFPGLSAVPTGTFTTEGAYTNYNFYSYNEPNEDYWNTSIVYGTSGWTYETGAPTVRTDKGILFNRYNMASKTYVETGGNLSSSDKVFDVTYTLSSILIENGVTATRDHFDGWNMAGNPYTSAVDWDLVTLNGIESGIYYFDGSNYRYYITGGGTSLYEDGITLNGGSRYIPAGQGFMVKVDNIGNTTFTIPQTARVHNDQAFYKSTTVIPNLLRFEVEKDGFTDESVVRTLPLDATEGHDGQYDAFKMYAWDQSKPQIFSISEAHDIQFAINSLPEIKETKVVPIGIYVGETGNYVISATENSFEGVYVYLIDRNIDALMPFNTDASYTYNLQAGINTERFALLFEPKSIVTGCEDLNNTFKLFPNPNDGTFYISSQVTDKGTIEVKDMTGKLIYSGKLTGAPLNEIKLGSVPTGMYFVTIQAGERNFVEKIVIQK